MLNVYNYIILNGCANMASLDAYLVRPATGCANMAKYLCYLYQLLEEMYEDWMCLRQFSCMGWCCHYGLNLVFKFDVCWITFVVDYLNQNLITKQYNNEKC